MKDISLTVTTDGSGDGSATSSVSANGLLLYLQLVDGDFADGVDVTVTFEHQNISIPVLTMANFNTDQMIPPKVADVLNTDGSALTTYSHLPALGYPKVVIAQGGDTKTGTFVFYVLE